MSAYPAPVGLVDRETETAVLDRLLAHTRGGSSGALVLRGEAGIGKSALLEYAAAAATGMLVLRVGGVEAEFELPFAALYQLLGPLLDRVGELPEIQRNALASAFGPLEEPTAGTFLVALGALNLLSNAAEKTPVLCIVDDAEWVDNPSAQVFAFTARRLDSDRILMLFGLGEASPDAATFAGLPTFTVPGLSGASSSELLDRAVGAELDDGVRARLISELDGNPLALLEIVRELTPAELRGSTALPDPLRIGERLEGSLLHRVHELPEKSQQLLLLVAAERSGEPGVIWRAAGRLGIPGSALTDAESTLRTGEQITFRHGLVRAAVYAAATEDSRRRTHLALADAMDPLVDPDRAVWHRAAAAAGADETVAAALEAAADTARQRGGYAATGAFLEFAARLTPDVTDRARRSLQAAEAQLAAGALEKASILLAAASAQTLDEQQRVNARQLRAELALARGENGHTAELLLESAREIAPVDPARARATYLRALMLTLFAGRLGQHDGVSLTARAARSAPHPARTEATGADLLLQGLGVRFTDGPKQAAPILRDALHAIRDYGDLTSVGPSYQAAFEIWDDDALHALATRRADLAQAAGALVELPHALTQLGSYELLAGRFDAAAAYFHEATDIARATGNLGSFGSSELAVLQLEAWRGRETETRALAQKCASEGTARGLGAFVGFTQHVLVVLELGLCNYKAALTAAQDACLDDLLVTRTLPDLVEAAIRSDEPEAAAAAARTLEESAVGSGSSWGLGMLARSRALIAEDEDAETLYREAIDHLKHCRAVTHLARARLVYGEWLRRMRRRRDARDELRPANELFESMGAEAFAQRAQTELAATGERRRRRTPEMIEELTPQEWRIATLVSEGATNNEVAAQLYISQRTVEYHLSKVFRKLGVNSRTELTRAVLEDRRTVTK